MRANRLFLALLVGMFLFTACSKEDTPYTGELLVTYRATGKTRGNVYTYYYSTSLGETDTLNLQASPFSRNQGIRVNENRTLSFRVENNVAPNDTDNVTIEILVDGAVRTRAQGRPPQEVSVPIR
jgi:hypothetical protein